MVPTWWRSLNPTSSADSSSCVATAMWRSTPLRSSSSCRDRLRPTESGMKMREKTTVDFRGSTGRREGAAPSRFTAGTSLTFGLSPLRRRPELARTEWKPVRGTRRLHDRVLARGKAHLGFGAGRQLHCKDLASGHRAPWGAANLRIALRFLQVPDPAVFHKKSLSPELVDQHPRLRRLQVVDVYAQRRCRRRKWVYVRGVRNLSAVGRLTCQK